MLIGGTCTRSVSRMTPPLSSPCEHHEGLLTRQPCARSDPRRSAPRPVSRRQAADRAPPTSHGNRSARPLSGVAPRLSALICGVVRVSSRRRPLAGETSVSSCRLTDTGSARPFSRGWREVLGGHPHLDLHYPAGVGVDDGVDVHHPAEPARTSTYTTWPNSPAAAGPGDHWQGGTATAAGPAGHHGHQGGGPGRRTCQARHGGPCLPGCAGPWSRGAGGSVGVRRRYPGRVGLGPVLAGLAVVVAACSTAAAPIRALPVPGLRPPAAAPHARPVLDPAWVHADELGAVPVLMYHQIVARTASDYDQIPAQFRGRLEQLYAHHFRTITAAAVLASGRVDLPAGTSPMVLTFDDSTVSQYAEQPDGTVAPDCAVGILLSVARP